MTEHARKFRAGLFAFGIVLVFAGLLGRLLWIQIVQHQAYEAGARRAHFSELVVRGQRGTIFDRHGRVMAMSVPTGLVFADPALVQDPERTSEELAPYLGLGAAQIQKALLVRDKRFISLKSQLPIHSCQTVAQLRLPGIGWQEEDLRFYPMGPCAAQILGFVGTDGHGLEGLELLFDPLLRPEPGRAEVPVDARRRRVLPVNVKWQSGPTNGESIVLTIDMAIQEITEQELEKAWQKWRPLAAMAIVMSPRTGEILAMASRPGYDPNRFAEYPADARRNRVVTDVYEPGSVMKPFIAAAVLQEHLADRTDKIFCENGAWALSGRVIHDHHAYGWLTLQDVIAKSSNVGAAKLGVLLGDERLCSYLKLYGFDEPTGVTLPGEAKGVLRELSEWTKDSAPSIAIGHEISSTPLQLLTAYATFANGGLLVRPVIVLGTADARGRLTRFSGLQKVVRRVLTPEVAREMREEILAAVVESGTGKGAASDQYRLGGKTGTAQKLVDGRYARDKHVGSFVGFGPVSNPKLFVVVIMDEPNASGAYYGGTVAAPTVGRILERSLIYMDAASDKPHEM